MINPITYERPEIEATTGSLGINFDFFTSDKASVSLTGDGVTADATKKRGRPKKKTMSDGSEVILADDNSSQPLSQLQSNEPYESGYEETNNMLRAAIMQADMLNQDIKEQLDIIKPSKTLKKKYEYISELINTSSGLINTKLSAIKELNKVKTDCHNLELKRIKELKLNVADEQDDDKRIMDMYNAFINTPVSSGMQLAPPIIDMTLSNGNDIVRADVGTSIADAGYSSYINNLSPEQNRMIMEKNPNIKTVVKYDQGTGNKWFDVIDITTGMSVPNMPVPSDIVLQDTQVSVARGTARNANIDTTYPLIVLGSSESIMDY